MIQLHLWMMQMPKELCRVWGRRNWGIPATSRLHPVAATHQIDGRIVDIYTRKWAYLFFLYVFLFIAVFSAREVTCSRHSSGNSQSGQNKPDCDKPNGNDD